MSTRRPGRAVVVYAAVLIVGAVALAIVLSAGRGLDAAPQLAAHSEARGAATGCLGEDLAAIQSGVHLDVHGAGSSAAGGPVGTRLLRGEVDRDSGIATLAGHCAGGEALAGQIAVAQLEIRDEAARGWVEVDGRRLDLRMVPSAEVVAGSAQAGDHLDSGELVARVFLAVAVILVAARLVGAVFARIRLTQVMGEIIAGIMLGPSLLGALAPEAAEYLFPPQVTAILQVVGQFGLIFFMFLVGLELNRRLVRGLGRSVVLLSHASIVVPFVSGAALALLLYPELGSGDFTGFALFLGAAMAITAFPVLARILADTGLNRTALGALAITCAAVDDLTAWCILAGVVAIVMSTGPADVVTTLVELAVFVTFMMLVARPVLRSIAIRLQRRGRLDQALVPGVFVGLLLSAWATEMIGIHAIFGAFVFGVAMPRPAWLKADLHGRLEDVTLRLLLPVFFAVVGLSTRIALLDSVALWVTTVVVIGVAIFGKFGGSMLASRTEGYSWRDSTALGLLMNTRGLTEIVILTVGQRLGVISPALFAILVLMALTTTLMATPLLSIIYPPSMIAREAATLAASTNGVASTAQEERHVVAWLTGQTNDSAVYDLATAVADGRGLDLCLLQHGNEARLDEALRGAAAVVVSATGLAEELAHHHKSRELLASASARVLVVQDADPAAAMATAEPLSAKGAP